MIQPVRNGNRSLVNKLNEIIKELNQFTNLKGDAFIGIDSTPEGKTVKLMLNQLLPRIPGTGGGDANIHLAWVKTQPTIGGNNRVDVFLDVDDPESEEVEVRLLMVGGFDAAKALPFLIVGSPLMVVKLGDIWYSMQTWMTWKECP